MRNFTIYLAALFCLLASKMIGQESFEKRAKEIATRIEKITKEEKAALKEEIEAVNLQLQAGTITKEKADEKKKVLATVEFAKTSNASFFQKFLFYVQHDIRKLQIR